MPRTVAGSLTRALALACAILVAPACGWAQATAGAAGSAGPGERSPLPTASELERHVDFLAADDLAGRRAGTPGAERAARYIVRAFQEAGLEPAQSHPTYLQTFDFPVGVELGPENRLVLQRGSRLSTIFTPGTDFLPLAGSTSDRVVQPVVFAGYGISAPSTIGYDDYEDVDVEGKIVLVLRYGPDGDDPAGRFGRYLSERYKAATAAQKGARAILFVNPPATMEIDRLIAFDPDERPNAIGIPAVSVSQGLARRIVAAAGHDLSVLQHEIDRTGEPRSRVLGDAVLNLRVDVRARTRTTHNVIGVVEGRDPSKADEVLVVGAHYDGLGLGGPGSLDPVPGEIHNGADDNASGVSALIELAQYFAYPTNRPDRTVMFVSFGAEEVGMLGSAWFVAHPPVPLADVVAMVNMDVIGRLREELKVYGVGSSPSWMEVLTAANRHLDLPVRPIAEGYGPSDQAAFYVRRIPVLSFFTGVHEDYHRSTDDAEEIDVEGLHAVTRLVQAVVEGIANGESRPRFDPRETPVPDVGEPSGTTLGGRIGAVPAPVETDREAGGVAIDYVVEGSPAAAAGIEAGDAIVEVSGQPVGDPYAYKRALDALVPGRAVTVVVERDGERVELSVVPQPAEPEPEEP